MRGSDWTPPSIVPNGDDQAVCLVADHITAVLASDFTAPLRDAIATSTHAFDLRCRGNITMSKKAAETISSHKSTIRVLRATIFTLGITQTKPPRLTWKSTARSSRSKPIHKIGSGSV